MTNILTQEEIDALLLALTPGAESEPELEPEIKVDERAIKRYDFRTANKFPKDQLRTLKVVFQSFGQLFSNRLTGILHTSSECEVLSVEELSFNEFNNSLPSPVILTIMQMEPMYGSQILQISPEAAYLIVTRLLGGSTPLRESNKPFTEIEVALAERVVRQIMPVLEEAWDKVIAIKASVERIETSPQFAQIVAPSEAVAVATLNLRIGDEEGLISLCIPHTAIEPVAKRLNTRMWFSAQEVRRMPGQAESLSKKVQHAAVTLTAYFDDTPAAVADIMHLQVGDVIRLSQPVREPLKVKIQHIPKFTALMGRMGRHYAVKLVDLIREEEKDESVSRGD
ncbi:MAG: flagellar motor switch protein FliM [Clostridiales bacterium]|nr:flagellar motor switch protein FliM [Clostridiales bacterium]